MESRCTGRGAGLQLPQGRAPSTRARKRGVRVASQSGMFTRGRRSPPHPRSPGRECRACARAGRRVRRAGTEAGRRCCRTPVPCGAGAAWSERTRGSSKTDCLLACRTKVPGRRTRITNPGEGEGHAFGMQVHGRRPAPAQPRRACWCSRGGGLRGQTAGGRAAGAKPRGAGPGNRPASFKAA